MKALVKLLICSILVLPFVAHDQVQAEPQPEQQSLTAIPTISKVNQISPTQLQVIYNQPVDKAKGI